MRFVNTTARPTYTKMSGPLGPGETSSDGGSYRRLMERAMKDVVEACGSRLGIRLNENEAELLERIIALDEKGRSFSKASLPKSVLEDPMGLKKAEKAEDEAQRKELEAAAAKNRENAAIEAAINGEIDETAPGTAEPDSKESAKSGFAKIMEENAKIEASHTGDREVLEGKLAQNAETSIPVPEAADSKNAMDRQAAEMASKMSVLSVLDNPPAKGKVRGRGKGKKS